ncbi:MAG: tyrosine-type recombinase/integrase [Nitrospirales bacterium]
MTTKQRDAFLAHAVVREQQGLLPYSLRIMWALRVKTGMRPEEARGMHVGDIDLSANTIRIERAVSLGRIKETKTHERRYVDVSEGLAAQLADFVHFAKAQAVANNLPEPNWLFPGRQGGLVTEADERWHRDLFKQVVHAAHLPRLSPMTFATPLRHSCFLVMSRFSKSQISLAMPNRPRRSIIMRSGFPAVNSGL